jgi:dynein heavy chain
LKNTDWGLCEEEQRKEFQHVFDKLAIELREAMKSLTSNIKLDEIPEEFENEAKVSGNAGQRQNTQMIAAFEGTFKKWIDQITNHYEKEDNVLPTGTSIDQGPRSELEYWRRKMRKLTCISE